MWVDGRAVWGSQCQGKFLEIEFNRAGAPVGATITNYLLGQLGERDWR